MLTGRAPAQFTLAAAPADQPLALQMPATPAGLPSELLEHRPDIAGAERRAAAANANIGVAKAAYFPQLTLSASGGFGGAALANLFDTPGRVWSLGAALAQTIFDGGLRTARVNAGRGRRTTSPSRSTRRPCSPASSRSRTNSPLLRLLDQETTLQDQAVQLVAAGRAVGAGAVPRRHRSATSTS